MLGVASRLLRGGPLRPLKQVFLCRSFSTTNKNGCQLKDKLFLLLNNTGPQPVLTHSGCGSGSQLSAEQQHEKLLQELIRLEDTILAANWADSVALMQDGIFWDAELARLEAKALPFADIDQVSERLQSVRRLFDLLRITEDVRDHLNEIMEQQSRSSGIGGTGLRASEKVSNLEEHAAAGVRAFESLMKSYPEFSAKTEAALGYGLALLRQKGRFPFKFEHKYFF